MTTEVIELMPGKGRSPHDFQSRPDWSPIAQPPGKDGVLAHTPDPSAYHRSADGRTVLPRATKHGASRAFDSQRPGVLTVDPVDPVTGSGGTVVDVEDLRRDEALLREAAGLAEGDPAIAWDLVTKGRAERELEENREAPPMTGYVVPASTPGGRQVTGKGNFAAGILAPGTTAAGAAVQPVPAVAVINPAVHHKESVVKPPQTVLVGPPAPAANQAPAPAQPPVSAPEPAQAIAPALQPAAQPQIAPAQQMILEALGGLVAAVKGLQGEHSRTGTAPPEPVAQAVPLAPQQEVPHSQPGIDMTEMQRQIAVEQRHVEPMVHAEPSQGDPGNQDSKTTERQMDTHIFGLAFLQPVPQKPQIKVIFDLGPGGQHLKRFHHVEITKDVIVLVYDDRYEGDRFHPPSTAPGEPIQVVFPDRGNEPFYVLVPSRPRLNFALGCLDILELVVTEAPGGSPPRSPEEQTDAELRTWRNEIPTRWAGEDQALEQAIISGRFDGGAGGAV